MWWQFVSKWQMLHSLDVQKHKSSSELVTGWRTLFNIVGHLALLNWHINAGWKSVPPVPHLASFSSWTSKSRPPCANIFGHLLRLTTCCIMERHFGEKGRKRPACRLQRGGTGDSCGWRGNVPLLCEITSALQELQHKQFQISQICKENQEFTPIALHNAHRLKDQLAEAACLWLLFVRNTSNSLTNSILMVCERGSSFFLHHYSVDIMWGNKLNDDWSGKWLLVYCNSV